tara:strand:+ start:424 stop:735 length:312 start_codon:yes stop_codon:yes gene_type:complete
MKSKLDKKKLNLLALKSLRSATKGSKVKIKDKSDKVILLGDGSLIDSIAFVNFIVGLEDLIQKETNKSFPIKIDKIHSINVGKTKLYFIDFVNALNKLINEKK